MSSEINPDHLVDQIKKLNPKEGEFLVLKGDYRNLRDVGDAISPTLQELKTQLIAIPEGMSLDQVDKQILRGLGLTHIDDTSHTLTSVLSEGGDWLGAAHSLIQIMFNNGGSVTWGTDMILRPEASVLDVERLCAAAVAADRNQRKV